MKRFIILFLVFIYYSQVHATEYDTIAANNPLLEYTGRIDFSDSLHPEFSYSGVSVRACFQGTSISLLLNDEDSLNYYNVLLDNNVFTKLQTISGFHTYEISKNLKDTIHEIELFKLSEEQFGKTQFSGLLLDKGKSLTDISDHRDLLIEFTGNSVVCGYGNEGLVGDIFSSSSENHYMTYAAMTSRSFSARHLAVCISGIGVYRNYGGPADGNADNMLNYYQRIFFNDALPLYNFTQKPDLICVDLGINDFSNDLGDSALFVNAYLNFLDTLQLKNYGTDILVLSGNDTDELRGYFQFVVDSTNKKNNGKVYFLAMSKLTGKGVNYHPTIDQHIILAKELINCIDTLKEWTIRPVLLAGWTKSAKEIELEFNSEIFDNSGNFDGFSISSENTVIPISEVLTDPSDISKIHIVLSSTLSLEQELTLSYDPGIIEGKDKIKLGRITSFDLSNNLTETKIIRASINKEGNQLDIIFNKKILSPPDLEGVLVHDDEDKIMALDSFNVSSTKLIIYLNSKVLAGNSVFLTLDSAIYGEDYVGTNPVLNYEITNNSLFNWISTSQINECIIYPNPVYNRIIYYSIPGNYTGQIAIQLFKIDGTLIDTRYLFNSTGSVDYNNKSIKQGTYILKIASQYDEYSKLIIF